MASSGLLEAIEGVDESSIVLQIWNWLLRVVH